MRPLSPVRQLLRAILVAAFVASIALTGTAGAAAAASDNRNGYSFQMYEDWCFDDITVVLCFEVHGRWTIVEQNDGDLIGTAAVGTRFYTIENGVVTAASIDRSVFQTKFVNGAATDELIISVGRVLTPGQQCIVRMLMRYVDGVIVIDHAGYSCN